MMPHYIFDRLIVLIFPILIPLPLPSNFNELLPAIQSPYAKKTF